MNVNFEKKGNVNAVLTITLNQDDYANDVKAGLAELGRKRTLKGFRPGHVPQQLLKKMFGNEVKANVVDRLISKSLSDYIVNNKINILGEPMLSADTKVDITADTEHTFKFDLGLAPELTLTVDKSVEIPYYNIEVSDKMLDEQKTALRKRFGKQVSGEISDENSLLQGSLTELNEEGNVKEGGIVVEKTFIAPSYLKDDEQKKLFVEKKVGDEFTFNPHKAFGGNATELAAVLNVDKEQANVESDFRFHVLDILVNKEADLDQEFFDNVLGKDEATDEATFTEKLKEMLANQLKNDSNYRFSIDAQTVLVGKAGEIELPEEFLKRYIKSRKDDKTTDNEVDEQWGTTAKQLQWQLIKEHVAKTNNLKLEAEDKLNLAKLFAANQFAQYGMGNVPEDVITKYAQELLEKPEYARDIEQRAMDDKIFGTVKELVTLKESNVSVEEFNKLFEEKKED